MPDVCTNGREAAFILDLPITQGGANQGPTPYELLGMALSGCVAITYISIAKNSRVTFEKLWVDIETFTPEGEQLFTRIDVVLHIRSDTNKDRLHRLLEKTVKTCHVGRVLLNAGVAITEKLVIE